MPSLAPVLEQVTPAVVNISVSGKKITRQRLPEQFKFFFGPNMPDEQAYKIVKAIFDHQKDLIAVHQEYASVKISNQKNSATSVPFHAGAEKYIKEKGGKLE